MSSIHQQYLNSENMGVIAAALARVRSLYKLDRGSEEERHVAAVMTGEFQIGNVTEDGLFSIFLGPADSALHTQRKQTMRRALQRWEDEGGTATEEAA